MQKVKLFFKITGIIAFLAFLVFGILIFRIRHRPAETDSRESDND